MVKAVVGDGKNHDFSDLIYPNAYHPGNPGIGDVLNKSLRAAYFSSQHQAKLLGLQVHKMNRLDPQNLIVSNDNSVANDSWWTTVAMFDIRLQDLIQDVESRITYSLIATQPATVRFRSILKSWASEQATPGVTGNTRTLLNVDPTVAQRSGFKDSGATLFEKSLDSVGVVSFVDEFKVNTATTYVAVPESWQGGNATIEVQTSVHQDDGTIMTWTVGTWGVFRNV